jgi:hypothetical protein
MTSLDDLYWTPTRHIRRQETCHRLCSPPRCRVILTPLTVARARRTWLVNRRALCPRLCPPHLYTENAGTFSAPGAPGRTRSSRESAGGPANSLLALDPGRYLPAPRLRQAGGMRLKDEADVYRGADVRSAKPCGAAPESGAHRCVRRPGNVA